MARDSGGTYTKALPDVVTGDTIEASWANSMFDDLETEMTDSLSRSGKGNMSVPFKAVAGSVSAPGLTFVSETNTGFYRASAGDIRFALAGSEFARITSSGLRLASNGLILATAGQGIDFSANTGTAATGATTTSELFDFYEEGTWTPNLWDTSLSSSESQTYSAQVGRFTRIGRVVFYNGYLAWTSLGSLTSGATVYIGPLPFTAVTLTNYNEPVHVGVAGGLTLGGAYGLAGNVASNTNFAQMYQFSQTSGAAVLTFAELQSAGSLAISGHYIVE